MLQVIFGDDEHTAADGPYVRLMKTRKWIYVTAAVGLLVANQYVDAKSLYELIKVFDVPMHYIGITIIVGLSYLTFQYAMISAQLISVYDIVLNERFRFRREDEMAAARARISSGEQKLREIARQVSDHPDIKSFRSRDEKLDSDEKLMRFGLSTGNIMALYNKSDLERSKASDGVDLANMKIDNISRERDNLQAKMSQRIDELNNDNMYEEAISDIKEAQKTYRIISDQNPADRYIYRRVEAAIDLVRIFPPLVIGIFAIFSLSDSLPQLSLLNVKESKVEVARQVKVAQAKKGANVMKVERQENQKSSN